MATTDGANDSSFYEFDSSLTTLVCRRLSFCCFGSFVMEFHHFVMSFHHFNSSTQRSYNSMYIT